MTDHAVFDGRLDILTVGRSSVDLYAQQSGCRLENASSFAKYVGGSPTNTAVGAARLGLKAGLLTRVGDDHMGRFIRERLIREGVDVTGVSSDPERLTALVLLGLRDRETFPLIFYRENCADMALDTGDVGRSPVGRADAVLINGTHLSTPGVRAASMDVVSQAKENGAKVVFDVDYRPVLWGLAAKDAGENRYVADANVTAALAIVLPDCDLIVGTEEEMHVLGGTSDTIAALRNLRESTTALLVLKRGAEGCVAFPTAIPDDLEGGVAGRRFSIEVFNVLGAGDAFMAGFLRGWLRGEPLETSCTWGNACGALVVSRHGCAPAEPTWEELQLFLSRKDWPHRLRDAAELEHLHWATTRRPAIDDLAVLAVDHRSQFEDLASETGAEESRIPAFKTLVTRALDRVTVGASGCYGLLVDGRFGADALARAADLPIWLGRPIELPGSRPLRFEGGEDPAAILVEWPADQVVKCLVFHHPDDGPDLQDLQDAQVRRLFAACRATGHEFLLEVIASKHGPVDATTAGTVMEHYYDQGVFPDWWKLEPSADPESWAAVDDVLRTRDPLCRGVVLLGLSAPVDELLASFAVAARCPAVKGFAVGRTIWYDTARRWLAGDIGNEEAIGLVADNFRTLVDGWRSAKAAAREA